MDKLVDECIEGVATCRYPFVGNGTGLPVGRLQKVANATTSWHKVHKIAWRAEVAGKPPQRR